MNNNLSLLVFVMDRSGSMSNVIEETIKGYNSLIEDQRKEEKNGLSARVTLAIFDDNYNLIYDYKDINKVKDLDRSTFYARGFTSLYDAIGKTINTVGERLNDIAEEDRPSKVLFTIFTDGQENSSKEFSQSKIKEMIEHQENKYSWVFNFVGANIDSYSVGSSMGINAANISNYKATSKGTTDMLKGMSAFYTVSRHSDRAMVGDLASFIQEEEIK